MASCLARRNCNRLLCRSHLLVPGLLLLAGSSERTAPLWAASLALEPAGRVSAYVLCAPPPLTQIKSGPWAPGI